MFSPYIELGADVIEVIIAEVTNNEFSSASEIDYYYSAGLEIRATDKFSFSLYAKKYNFYFREDLVAPVSKFKQESYGVGVIKRF